MGYMCDPVTSMYYFIRYRDRSIALGVVRFAGPKEPCPQTYILLFKTRETPSTGIPTRVVN